MKTSVPSSLLIAFLASAAPALGTVFTGSVTGDTYIRSDSGLAGTPQNGDTDNEFLVGSNGATNNLRGMLRFDVSSIITDLNTNGGGNFSNLVINSASLQVFERRGRANTVNVIVSDYNFAFDPATATWNAPATGDTTAGGTVGATLGSQSVTWEATADNEDATIALTPAAVKTGLQNHLSNNLHFILTTTSPSQNFLSIRSDLDGAQSARFAKLTIDYTVLTPGGPELSVDPASPDPDFAFGSSPIGQTPSRTVRFKNTSPSQSITVSAVNLTNNTGTAFTLGTLPSLPAVLAVGDTIDIPVTASSGVKGSFSGSVFVDTDAAGQDQTLPLTITFSADTLAQWTPVGGDETTSDYNNSGQTPGATLLGNGVSASVLTRVNQPIIANGGAVWPGYIANVGGTEGTYDPVTGGYTEFTISPVRGGTISYSTISYPLNSYGGMNDAAGYTGVVRSSVDGFSSELDAVTIINASSATFVFDVSSLGAQTNPVTFRLYVVDNAGPNTWADMSNAGGGLIIDGIASAVVTEPATWTSDTNDFWEIGGPADNWTTSDGFFQQGDSVTFDDTVNPAFSGTVEILGNPVPGAININNSVQDYVFAGEIGAGSGTLTKSGTGLLRLAAPDSNMPFNAPIVVNGGTLELGGDTRALQNSPGITVNSTGTFRLAAGNAGQDTVPPIQLAGGTLENNDGTVFLFPGSSTVTLAPGTDSILTGTGTLIPFSSGATFFGSGNLIKRGTGTLTVQYVNLENTGSVTIESGLIEVFANRTAASADWSISGGELRLLDDSAAPIENLPDTATIDMTGGELDVTRNTETIASLAMDSTGAPTLLSVANDGPGTTTASLTVTTLELAGTQNFVVFDVAPDPGTYEVLNTTTFGSGALGTNLLVQGVDAGLQSWSFVGGVVSVTIASADDFDSWMAGFTFEPGADLTAGGDADDDGLANIIENVLGTPPNTQSTGLTGVDGSTGSLTFSHPLNPDLASDVSYGYEWSTDLSEWELSGDANTGGTVVDIVPGAPVADVVEVTATVSIGSASRVFVRLTAVQGAP